MQAGDPAEPLLNLSHRARYPSDGAPRLGQRKIALSRQYRSMHTKKALFSTGLLFERFAAPWQ
ncbi:hypothetical protein BA177_06990 [Woeseia oceani]|uniref:Uncharacterized protein n=1 Tax=Woeseia oceani TaxID=1548547 RepID=A0A193LEU3_9GAMM|nr:hypothetical protein BA177_06990 [Woeseia oceani]